MTVHSHLSVAVVDDDECFCRSVSRWLHASAFVAAIYRSAEDFLEDPYNGRFACLLVDIELGGMSGLEMQRELVAQGSCAPVIFITALDDPTAIAEAERSGCAFLRKTVDGLDLMETIRMACR